VDWIRPWKGQTINSDSARLEGWRSRTEMPKVWAVLGDDYQALRHLYQIWILGARNAFHFLCFEASCINPLTYAYLHTFHCGVYRVVASSFRHAIDCMNECNFSQSKRKMHAWCIDVRRRKIYIKNCGVCNSMYTSVARSISRYTVTEVRRRHPVYLWSEM